MDLNQLQSDLSDQGVTMEFHHPTTGDLIEGMTVTVLGVDSEAFENRTKRKNAATFKRAQSRGRDSLTPEQATAQIYKETTEDLVALTKDWTGFVENGEVLECTPENVRRVYTNRGLSWIRSKVSDFVNDRGNFFSQ